MKFYIIIETDSPDVEDILDFQAQGIADAIGFRGISPYSVSLAKDMGHGAGKTISFWTDLTQEDESLQAQD